jgi:20S proteasome alpha/beta subunit
MTLIVGFIAEDGAVIAADSEATESGHSRFDVEKIWKVGKTVFGHSGSMAIAQEVRHALDAGLPPFVEQNNPDRWTLKDYLTSIMNPILQKAYSSYVGSNYREISGVLMIVGRDSEGYFLLEIDGNNTATFYDTRQFHAIGSGSPSAYSIYGLMENYDSQHQSVEQLKLVSYRMLDTCINSIGGPAGVGGRINIWTSDETEGFRKIPSEETEIIKYGVDQWKLSEKETLDRLYEADETQSEQEISMPEELID